MVITDGVFSMEGSIAPLPDLLELCRRHDAVLVVDDSHATGVLGTHGRGTAEHFGLRRRGRHHHLDARQGARRRGRRLRRPARPRCATTSRSAPGPQLFSNALPPTVAASALASVEYLEAHPERVATPPRATPATSASGSSSSASSRCPGETPIIPVILGETAAAIRMSELLLAEGVFVTGFGFPVVPQGQARVRCQISAAHTRDDLDQALAAFRKVGRQLGLI